MPLVVVPAHQLTTPILVQMVKTGKMPEGKAPVTGGGKAPEKECSKKLDVLMKEICAEKVGDWKKEKEPLIVTPLLFGYAREYLGVCVKDRLYVYLRQVGSRFVEYQFEFKPPMFRREALACESTRYGFTAIHLHLSELLTADDMKSFDRCALAYDRIPVEKRKGHANYLVSDEKFHSLEHFEPHGEFMHFGDPGNGQFIHDLLWRAYDENPRYGHAYTFIPSSLTCPRVGPQAAAKDRAGTCSWWSSLIAYLRVSCTQDVAELQSQIVGKGSEYLRELVQGWYCRMLKYSRKKGFPSIVEKLAIYMKQQDLPIGVRMYTKGLVDDGYFDEARRVLASEGHTTFADHDVPISA